MKRLLLTPKTWTVVVMGLSMIAVGILQADDKTDVAGKPLSFVQKLAEEVGGRVEFFAVEGHPAFIIRPARSLETDPKSWVWYAPVIGHPNVSHSWMLQQWLAEGISMAGVAVGESYGSPAGTKIYTAFWRELTTHRGMSKRPCLLPQSRGGLMLYNWAVENPDHVACIAGIYTVVNLRSYPGLKRACEAYGLTPEELAARLDQHNPIRRVQPLAVAGVPILHVHGDSDRVVPLDENSGLLSQKYRNLGGDMQLIVVPGKGHEVCAPFFQCQKLVDFVVEHAKRPDR